MQVSLEGIKSDISPIHWQYGAIARLKKGEVIDKYLHNGYSTLSLGYIGLYETTILMKHCSHTTNEGEEFAYKVMNRLSEAVDKWKKETKLGFALYGTPAESLCYRFAKIDRERFGDVKDVTDKGYYTNSYHVDVRAEIDGFKKLTFESGFQQISSGGAISLVEIPNMGHNLEALETMIQYIYDNIQYAEFNTKSDYCQICGYDGEIIINDDLEWECPNCGNKDHSKMSVVRRTCGYLGENFWNVGKTKEISARVSLFVSGCTHHCRDCFNQEAWDFTYGDVFTNETQEEILDALKPDYIAGFSLLGGEPFEPENQKVLLHLLKEIKKTYPSKSIWCYTGYLFDKELLCHSRARCQETDEMLFCIDVLVDGEFDIHQKDITLRFRGSTNQRIIDVKESLREGRIIPAPYF